MVTEFMTWTGELTPELPRFQRIPIRKVKIQLLSVARSFFKFITG
jgi:hypothetical protein